ncbi:MAG: M23 family metallopeptidase [bacterium]|nr:M23 family metallopeptidase [bacterium]
MLLKFFGFGKRGRSLLGEKLTAARTNKHLRKILSLSFVFVVFIFTIVPNFSYAANIGGVPVLNVSPSTKLIETATKITVRVPVKTIYISQKFGWFHSGIDLVAHTGTPVYPLMDGVVVHTEEAWYGYGHQVVVDHGARLSTLYAHLSKILVKTGDKVTINTQLGLSGSTGFSTGPHLHLELHQDGKIIDPAELLPEIVTK